MSRCHRWSASGLTLIELLIAVTLSALVIAATTAAVVQMRKLAQRVLVRQRMHDNARVIFERFYQDVSALSQTSAFFISRTSVSGSGRIEVVFLRGKYTPLDFTTEDGFGRNASQRTDLVWTRWLFDDASRQIQLSSSSPYRKFLMSANWTNPTGTNFSGRPFFNLPTPQRAAIPIGSPTASATLDQNRYGSADPNDLGDYADLVRNSIPLALDCENVCVEVVPDVGVARTFTTTSASPPFAASGQYVDGRNSPELADRPRLIRVRFDLTEPRLEMRQTFSFCFQTPAFLP